MNDPIAQVSGIWRFRELGDDSEIEIKLTVVLYSMMQVYDYSMISVAPSKMRISRRQQTMALSISPRVKK